MGEFVIKAELDNLELVNNYVNEKLVSAGFSEKQIMKVDIAVEEIFSNVVNYAYNPQIGEAEINCNIQIGEKTTVVIEFSDCGKPYNPLEKQDPDITLSAEERDIGGLGIFMAKKIMDSMEYRYEEGKNILVITKQVEEC